MKRLLIKIICKLKVGLNASGWLGDVMSVGICVLVVFLAACKVCFRKECNAMFIAVDNAVRSGDAKGCN